jgi:cytochrome c
LNDYYNGKLFIYEWIRGWIMAVTFDEKGNYLRMEPFLKQYTFAAPVDMQFSRDGALYVLEYGTNWFSKNTDARLVRIEYVEGNRNPVAEIELDRQYGAAPFNVQFSAKKTFDHDRNDQLTYTWSVENVTYEGLNPAHTFTKPGVYSVKLSVSDDKGGKTETSSQVFVGNTPPEIQIFTNANRSFYWDNVLLDYQVKITDLEDKNIDENRLNITYGYIARGKDVAIVLTQNQSSSSLKYLKGQQLAANLNCKACHALDKASVGPSFVAIAERYAGKQGMVATLSDKIIKGGGGVWGERAMIPHPNLSKDDAAEIVNYILSLSDKSTIKRPSSDAIELKDHIGKGNEGSYLLNVSYTDLGANGIQALQSRNHITLRSPWVQAEDFDSGNVRIATYPTENLAYARAINHETYVRFNKIDLNLVKQLLFRVEPLAGGKIEVRLGKIDGLMIGETQIPAAIAKDSKPWKELIINALETKGIHDLYFVFKSSSDIKQNLFHLDWIYFSNKSQ